MTIRYAIAFFLAPFHSLPSLEIYNKKKAKGGRVDASIKCKEKRRKWIFRPEYFVFFFFFFFFCCYWYYYCCCCCWFFYFVFSYFHAMMIDRKLEWLTWTRNGRIHLNGNLFDYFRHSADCWSGRPVSTGLFFSFFKFISVCFYRVSLRQWRPGYPGSIPVVIDAGWLMAAAVNQADLIKRVSNDRPVEAERLQPLFRVVGRCVAPLALSSSFRFITCIDCLVPHATRSKTRKPVPPSSSSSASHQQPFPPFCRCVVSPFAFHYRHAIPVATNGLKFSADGRGVYVIMEGGGGGEMYSVQILYKMTDE